MDECRFVSNIFDCYARSPYVKALRPEVKVIGVEADDAAGKFKQSKVRPKIIWYESV